MAEELALRFIGYDLVSPVARQVGSSIDRVAGQAKTAGGSLSSGATQAMQAGVQATAVFGTALGAVVLGIKSTTQSAADLEYQLNLLQTHANMPGDPVYLKQMRDALMGMSKYGYDAIQAAQAQYYIQSAGIHNVTDATALEIAAMKTAQMTHADLNDTTFNLVTTMQALPDAFKTAQEYAGAMNAIVGSGIMTFDDLNKAAKTGVYGVGATLGANLQQMGALIDTLTREGFPAASAAMTLRNIMLAIPNPSKAAAEAFAAMGLNQGNVAHDLATQGPLKALQDIRNGLLALPKEERIAVLDKLFHGSKQSGQASVMIQGLMGVPKTLNDINSSIDNFNANWDKTTGIATVKAAQLKAAITDDKVAIGNALLPSVKQLMDAVTPLVLKFASWVDGHQALIAQAGILAVRFLLIATAMAGLFTAGGFLLRLFSPMGVVMLLVGAASTYVSHHLNTIIPKLHQIALQYGPRVISFLQAMGRVMEKAVGDALPYLRELFHWFLSLIPPIESVGRYILRIFLPALKTALRPVVQELGRAFKADLLPQLYKFGDWLTGPGNTGVRQIGNAIIQMIPYVVMFSQVWADVARQLIMFLLPILERLLPFFIDILGFLEGHGHIVEFVMSLIIAKWVFMKTLDPFIGAYQGAVKLIGVLGRLTGITSGAEFLGGIRGTTIKPGEDGKVVKSASYKAGQFIKAVPMAIGTGISKIVKGVWDGAVMVASFARDMAVIAAKAVATAARVAAEFIASAAKATAAWAVQKAQAVALFVEMAARSMWAAGVMAAQWAMQASRAVASFVMEAAAAIASFVVMGAGAMAAGIEMAAAWVIGLGPIGLIIAAVGLLVLAISTNFLGLRDKIGAMFSWIGDHWKQVLSILLLPLAGPIALFIGFKDQIIGAFQAVISWFRGSFGAIVGILLTPFRTAVTGIINLWKSIGSVISGVMSAAWTPIRALFNGFISAINTVIEFIDRIHIPDKIFGIPIPGVGGAGFSIPKIPQLASGGFFEPYTPTPAIVGEGTSPEIVAPEPKFKQWVMEAMNSVSPASAGDAQATSHLEHLCQLFEAMLAEMRKEPKAVAGFEGKFMTMFGQMDRQRKRGIRAEV